MGSIGEKTAVPRRPRVGTAHVAVTVRAKAGRQKRKASGE